MARTGGGRLCSVYCLLNARKKVDVVVVDAMLSMLAVLAWWLWW